MKYLALFLALFLIACEQAETAAPSAGTLACRGIFYVRDARTQALKKFNEYEQNGRCLIDNLRLTRLEETQENWRKRNVQCVPQPSFASRSLVAENNFYEYRNGKAYLQFDSETGIYKRIILAEGQDGEPLYSKSQGCFYQRTATGADAHHGNQILLDTQIEKLISSQYFDAMEIFSYAEDGNELNMLRFDETRDYDYTFCPTLKTEWRYCTKLRDGNSMYYPNLPTSDRQTLTAEAVLLSRQFNWVTISKSKFDQLWHSVSQSRAEAMREDYKYEVIFIPDVPRFIDAAWREYLMGLRPTMPDTSSSQMIPICYRATKSVNFDDGSLGKIYGEACYSADGTYSFTPF